ALGGGEPGGDGDGAAGEVGGVDVVDGEGAGDDLGRVTLGEGQCAGLDASDDRGVVDRGDGDGAGLGVGQVGHRATVVDLEGDGAHEGGRVVGGVGVLDRPQRRFVVGLGVGAREGDLAGGG